MCSTVVSDFSFHGWGSLKSKWTIERYIPGANIYFSYTEVITSKISGSFVSDFSDAKIFFFRVQIVMILCYLYLNFAKSGNFLTYCCSERSHLVFPPIGITFVLSCWYFYYSKRCHFRCKLQNKKNTEKLEILHA